MASAAATAVAVVVAASASAETTGRAEQSRERPRGVVLDCSTQSGLGAGLREFRSKNNLIVGPLVLKGGGSAFVEYSDAFGGNKFPALLRGGHQVTVEVSRDARPDAGLVYGQLPSRRNGYRVVTFRACHRGEISGRFDGWPMSFWSGGVVARSPRCVPLFFWVDDQPSPRRAVIHLGMTDCR
jgi:hypothetical protein